MTQTRGMRVPARPAGRVRQAIRQGPGAGCREPSFTFLAADGAADRNPVAPSELVLAL